MAEQNYSNHMRWFPLFHFVVMPILLASAVWALWVFFRSPGVQHFWTAALTIGVFLGALASRAMAVKVQDRVIRLEMRLRLATLLPDDLRPCVPSLTPGQLVALRFAPDDELPGLVRQVAAGTLGTPKAIKQAIVHWQADHLRA